MIARMDQCVSFEVSCKRKSWVCSVIYTSPTSTVRSGLWNYLKHRHTIVVKLWLLMGDFNEILLPPKSKGGMFVSFRATNFEDMVDDH